jgi:uncharacterized protein YceK
MGKRRFFGVFVALCLMVFASLLAGCGSATKGQGEDTLFPGSYAGDFDANSRSTNGWLVSDNLSQTGSLTFTVDKKGEAFGLLEPEDGSTAVDFRAKFENDGEFSGVFLRNGETIPFWGNFSRQSILVPGDNPDAEGNVQLVRTSGLVGNFRQRVNGTEFTGFFSAAGGVIPTTAP